MLTFSDNFEYNFIFHNIQNKSKIIKQFTLLLEKSDILKIHQNIQRVIKNNIELCYDYTVISSINRVQNMISNFNIIIPYLKILLELVQFELKNSPNNTRLMGTEKILSTVIKVYTNTLEKLQLIKI